VTPPKAEATLDALPFLEWMQRLHDDAGLLTIPQYARPVPSIPGRVERSIARTAGGVKFNSMLESFKPGVAGT